MSYFKAKMHQIQFWLGPRSRPRWGNLQRSPGSLVGLKKPTSKGRGRGGRERMARKEEKGGEGTYF